MQKLRTFVYPFDSQKQESVDKMTPAGAWATDFSYEPAERSETPASFLGSALNMTIEAHLAANHYFKILHCRLVPDIDLSNTHWDDCLDSKHLLVNTTIVYILSVSDKPVAGPSSILQQMVTGTNRLLHESTYDGV